MKRLLLIFLALYLAACGSRRVSSETDVFYTCSMDPQVVSDKPGNCPICGMPLTPVKKSSVENTDDIELSAQQIKLGNIRVDTVGTAQLENSIGINGILTLDASRITSVSARVSGRIEKLHIKSTGDFISRGMPLYELYSEELNNAKQEYLLALNRRRVFTQSIVDMDEIIRAARHKLILWGMTDRQIQTLENDNRISLTTAYFSPASGFVTELDVSEGGYISAGATLLRMADLSVLWVEAQVYPSQLPLLPANAAATVNIPGEGMSLRGQVSFINPEADAGGSISLLRISVPNRNNRLRPGMPVNVILQQSSHSSIVLPADAVIRGAGGSTVWVQTGENRFRSRMVSTGRESNGSIEILYGLSAGDSVVVSGAYLLHSEFFFKRGADPMATHAH